MKETPIISLQDAAELAGQDTSKKIVSGFSCLDECLDGGFREGDLTVISGVPGDGKTTLARMFSMNLSSNLIPSLWFSYEMSHSELWESFKKMGASGNLVNYVPMELEDDLDWMFHHIDKAIKEKAVGAIFIDTLGDVVKSVKKQQELSNYATYLAQICKDLRLYAIKNKLMIFVIAHATKQTRSNTNETDNADIANSNGIPAAATNIFHIWRDRDDRGLSHVKIGKSRRDGTAKGLKFNFRFTNNRLLAEGKYEPLEDEFKK